MPNHFDDSLYSGYSSYNNWAAKAAASTTGLTKGFGWGLSAMGHHSQSFNMNMSSTPTSSTNGTSSMLGAAAGLGSNAGDLIAPPTTTSSTPPYSYSGYGAMYSAAAAAASNTSSSIASLRLKAKQSGFDSQLGTSYSSVSELSSSGKVGGEGLSHQLQQHHVSTVTPPPNTINHHSSAGINNDSALCHYGSLNDANKPGMVQ